MGDAFLWDYFPICELERRHSGMVRVVCSSEPKPMPVYPFGSWGGHPGARISWTSTDFLVINFDPSVPRKHVDLWRPGPEISLNRLWPKRSILRRDLGIEPVREVLKKHENKQ
ncbi:hypothetical protein TNCV_3885841 [Trichonephila clavipes]|nr:hypothetical protein TNCV_3885841 [Trichonephila clavipes]